MEEKYTDWEVDNAARILVKAHTIRMNEELMALVAPKLREFINTEGEINEG